MPTIDFTLATLIQCYRDGLVEPDPRYLLVGYESKEAVANIYYDLSRETNDDAIVLRRDPYDDENDLSFESFLELLAWTTVKNELEKCSNVCRGVFIDDGSDDAGNVLLKPDPVIKGFGFDLPIKTGKYRGILRPMMMKRNEPGGKGCRLAKLYR